MEPNSESYDSNADEKVDEEILDYEGALDQNTEPNKPVDVTAIL